MTSCLCKILSQLIASMPTGTWLFGLYLNFFVIEPARIGKVYETETICNFIRSIQQ